MDQAPGAAHLTSTSDLAALRDSVARVLTANCDSRAVHAFIDGKSNLEQELWARAAELGWLSLGLPEAYGGLGLGPQGLSILHAELGRRVAPGPYIATLAAAQWLVEFASESDKKAYLPPIAEGDLSVVTPYRCRSDLGLVLRDEALSGQLGVLGSGGAGLGVLPVCTGGTIESWALVSLCDSTTSLTPIDIWDRTRQVCILTCENAKPVALIADESGIAARALARHVALAVASDSVGAAGSIAEQTVEFMKMRVQFDRPIGSFQALKHRAANLVASIATNEHLLAQAVEAAALGSPDADMWAALAKAGASESFAFVAGDCVQLHGGVGHTWDFDAHIFVKRARLNETIGGNNRGQRDFAAAALAKATRSGRNTTELSL